MREIFLSVIIPAYKEEKRLPRTLLEVDRYLHSVSFAKICEKNGFSKNAYEILVVNDGSKDGTAKVVNKFAERLVKNLKLVDNKENHGKGWVVRQGMLETDGKFRIFTDADNSTTLDQVEKLLPYIKGIESVGRKSSKEGLAPFWDKLMPEFDVVVGSRALRKSVITVKQSLKRIIFGKLGNILIQLVALFGIWDSQCGFKLFTEKAAQDIFSRAKIDRWGFDIEALALARKLGYKIKEVPIIWENDPESRVSMKGALFVFVELIKIRWNLWTDKYNL